MSKRKKKAMKKASKTKGKQAKANDKPNRAQIWFLMNECILH